MNFQRLINAKSADMEEKFGAADVKAQAFMDSVRAKADFEELKIHWVDRANSARWALNVPGQFFSSCLW